MTTPALEPLPAAVRRAVQESSIFAKGLAGALVAGYLIGKSDFGHGMLALTPAYVSPPSFMVWTLVTAGLLESPLLGLILDCIAVFGVARFVEPLWGMREFARFVFVVNLFVNSATFFLSIALYFIANREDAVYSGLGGFIGVTAGFAVIFKQLMPEAQAGAVPLRVSMLPLTLVALVAAFTILGAAPYHELPFVIFGIYGAWMYLRYFQQKEGIKGDMSEAFSFTTFFPEALQPAVHVVSRITFTVFSKLRLIPRHVRTAEGDEYIVAGGSRGNVGGLQGIDPQDSERRRQIALRALDKRLNMAGIKSPAADGKAHHDGRSGAASPHNGDSSATPEPSEGGTVSVVIGK
eukprot:Opistho-2@46815